MTGILAAGLDRALRFVAMIEAEARDLWRAEGWYPPKVVEVFVWVHGNTPPEGALLTPTVARSGGSSRDWRQNRLQSGLTGLLFLAAALLAQ